MNEYISLLILAIIQGLTEFLPVSSSGHLAINQYLLNWPKENPLFLDVMLHTGTLFATLIYFKNKIKSLLRDLIINIKNPLYFIRDESGKILTGIILATIPTGIIGLSLEPLFISLSKNIQMLSIIFFIMGITLISTKKIKKGTKKLNLLDTILIGIVQGIAVIPAISRSGSTIAYLMLRGYPLNFSFMFSFLISIPAIFGASLIEIFKAFKSGGFKPFYTIGAIISFISGMLALKWLNRIINRQKFYKFGYYLIVLSIILFITGNIKK